MTRILGGGGWWREKHDRPRKIHPRASHLPAGSTFSPASGAIVGQSGGHLLGHARPVAQSGGTPKWRKRGPAWLAAEHLGGALCSALNPAEHFAVGTFGAAGSGPGGEGGFDIAHSRGGIDCTIKCKKPRYRGFSAQLRHTGIRQLKYGGRLSAAAQVPLIACRGTGYCSRRRSSHFSSRPFMNPLFCLSPVLAPGLCSCCACAPNLGFDTAT